MQAFFTIITILAYFILHIFYSEKFVKRGESKFAIVCMVAAFVYFLFFMIPNNSLMKAVSMISIIPFAYIANALAFRYLLFNKYTSNFSLKGEGYPYDPIITYSWSHWQRASTERRKATFLEDCYSFWILIAPLLLIILLYSNRTKS